MIGDTARQRMARRVLVAVLFGAAAAFFFGAPSNGYVSCTRDPANGEVLNIQLASSNDNVIIRRSAGGDFQVITVTGGTEGAPNACPNVEDGNADVNDISSVNIFVDPPGVTTATDAGAQQVTIDLSNGPFAPGALPVDDERDEDEIQWTIDLGDHATTTDEVIIKGGASDENIALGSNAVGGPHRINLDTTETVTDDHDVTLVGVEKVSVDLGAGTNKADASGTESGATGPLNIAMEFKTGTGNDTYTGGKLADLFQQGTTTDGRDTIVGGIGTDTVNYSGRTTDAVRVTIDATGDDGTGAEGDNIDVENINTGGGADYIEGTRGAARPVPDGGGAATSNDTNVINAGSGSDHVSYAHRTNPVTVIVTASVGTGNDGETGENDDIVSAEIVTGGTGNDSLTLAAAGTLNGGDGDDVLTAATAGAALLNGGLGNDQLTGSGAADTLNGDAGVDRLTGAGGADTLNGGDGNDELPNGYLNGDGGDDILNGGAGDDTLRGGTENDTLNGGAGEDTLDGEGNGTGNGVGDTATYADRTASTQHLSLTLDGIDNDGESGENDNLLNIENITGGAGNDVITANNSSNRILGGGGNDTIDGGSGPTGTTLSPAFDILDGEAGTDTLSYEETGNASVTVNLSTTSATTPQNTGGGGDDAINGFENLTGSDFADTLTGTAGPNVIKGGASDDTLQGGAGDDTLDGEAGGGDMADYSTLSTGVTVDLAITVPQNTGGGGTDTLAGIEELQGSSGDDVLSGTEETGPGTGGQDKLYGGPGAGDDVLNGRSGADTLNGGPETDPTPVPGDLYGIDSVSYADAGAGVKVFLDGSGTNTGEAVGDTVVSIEGAVGTPFNDELWGTNGENHLAGLAGEDKLFGQGGEDTLVGGPDDDKDTISGGSAEDTVDYSDVTNDLDITVGTGSTGRDGGVGDGPDVLANVEHAIGGSGDDRITGTGGSNELTGGPGDDELIGSDGDDTLAGNADDDVFRPGAGNDVVLGGGGTADVVDYSSITGPVTANLATGTGGTTGNATDTDQYDDPADATDVVEIEHLIGTNSSSADRLTGNDSDNSLRGLAGPDELNGGAGNDSLIGDAGGDTLIGEGGTDTADYSTASATSGVTANLRSNAGNTGDAAGDTYSTTATSTPVENLLGSPGNDTLAGDGNNNRIDGGAGTDTVTYAGVPSPGTVNASLTTGMAMGDGHDTLSNLENLTGSPQNDTLEGSAGNNALDGLAGTDTLTYANATAGVTVDLSVPTAQSTGGAGSDTVSNFENLTGSPQGDTLLGTTGNNIITGGAGTDTVSYANVTGTGVTVDLRTTTAQTTGAGDDTITQIENLTGSPQDDTLSGDGGANTINGGVNSTNGDTVTYAAATTTMNVNLKTGDVTGDGGDTVVGIENVIGSPQQDTIVGDDAKNTLSGGDSDDTINGGNGDDTESGGNGNDTFDQEAATNGADVLAGGDGSQDRVNYSARPSQASVTLDGAPNDGEAGENDNVGSDVELADLAATAPGAPTNVTASAGDKQATVSWTAPASNGGSPITGYTITATPGGTTASTGGSARSAVVAPLSNGTVYTFTVKATNARGTGPASAPSNAVRPTGAPSSTQGYALLGDDGGVFSFGQAGNFGSIPGLGLTLNQPPIGLAYTPSGNGYWIVAQDGGIFSFGDAKFFGSMGNAKLNAPVLGMEPTPTGGGYWLFGADGGIFSFGDAKFFGSMGASKLNAPVVGMAATSTGGGYWLVAQDGGIFSFGDAKFFGSMGGTTLNQPVFDMAPTVDNAGYYLVARDGGIFAFGSAAGKFFGSAAPANPATVIGIGTTPTGNGYWIADRNGIVYAFGDAGALGDLRGLGKTAVSFAALPK